MASQSSKKVVKTFRGWCTKYAFAKRGERRGIIAAEFTMFEGTTRWCHSKKFGSFDQFRIGVDVFRSKEEAERRVFTLIENRLKKLRAEIETLEMMRLEVGKA